MATDLRGNNILYNEKTDEVVGGARAYAFGYGGVARHVSSLSSRW